MKTTLTDNNNFKIGIKGLQVILMLLFLMSTTSCGEMLSALSTYNQTNGAQCATYTATSWAYVDGSWQEGKYFYTDDYTDQYWLEGLMSSYLNYNTFGTYYETSSKSGVEYKISVYCSQYYQ